MKKSNKSIYKNNFNGPMIFNGPIQIAGGCIENNNTNTDITSKEVSYTTEPVWRSPFTMAILTWISFVIVIAESFSVSRMVNAVVDIFSGNIGPLLVSKIRIYSIAIAGLFILFIFICSLKRITKNQTRYPVLFGFAISGYGGRLTLEKIHIEKCPICGGTMKYYNKAVEWIYISSNNGRSRREVERKVPVLECKRNAEHCLEMDPAEDKIK